MGLLHTFPGHVTLEEGKNLDVFVPLMLGRTEIRQNVVFAPHGVVGVFIMVSVRINISGKP